MKTRTLRSSAVAGAISLAVLGIGSAAVAATVPEHGTVAVAGDTDDETVRTERSDRLDDALQGLVDDGTITAEQRDAVTEALDGIGGPAGHGGDRGGRGPVSMTTAAETLDMTTDELRDALSADGATLASVAEDQGVATDDLVDALVAAAEQRLDAAVEEGRLTEGEADERRARLGDSISAAIESEYSGAGRGSFGPGERPDGSSEDGDGYQGSGQTTQEPAATADPASLAA
ncbi:hypothetical protein [Isoptericola haloaureus]|uniref:Uncharacterized protein n=1 Tax=Isoptericola haloaureus TaxID=1542902 RepID=A0ABU7Z7A6_9MICO